MKSYAKRQATGTSESLNVGNEMGSTIRVVIADDNREVLMATADLIVEFPGVEIVSLATNADEAVLAVELHRPDIVFVDAWLRGGGAVVVASRIRDSFPEARVVALASVKNLELVLRLQAVGAAGCYEKETLNAELPQILESARRR